MSIRVHPWLHPRGAIEERVHSCPLVSLRGCPATSVFSVRSVGDLAERVGRAFGGTPTISSAASSRGYIGDASSVWIRVHPWLNTRGAIRERVYSWPLVSLRGWPARGACLTSVEDGGREEEQAFGALSVKFTDFFVGDGIAP